MYLLVITKQPQQNKQEIDFENKVTIINKKLIEILRKIRSVYTFIEFLELNMREVKYLVDIIYFDVAYLCSKPFLKPDE